MQERRVRFLARCALLYLGLLLATVRAAHPVKMRVKAFVAALAPRRALVNCFALRTGLAVLPCLPFRRTLLSVAGQHTAGRGHYGVKRTVALDVAAKVRHQAVSGVRRDAGAAAE